MELYLFMIDIRGSAFPAASDASIAAGKLIPQGPSKQKGFQEGHNSTLTSILWQRCKISIMVQMIYFGVP